MQEPLSLPYAYQGWDKDGGYALCPACGKRCRGFDPTQLTAEDMVTKGLNSAYAEHYERNHR